MATAAGDELEKILPSVDNTPLDPDDTLFDVKTALTPVVAKWRAIGEGLRLKGGTLDVINANYPNDACSCMGAVASEWLKRNYRTDMFGEPTWRKLVEIIGISMGGNNLNHARKIAQEHPGSKPPSLIMSSFTQQDPQQAWLVSDLLSQVQQLQLEKEQLQKLQPLPPQMSHPSPWSLQMSLPSQMPRPSPGQQLPPTKHESVDERSIPQHRKRAHQPPQLPSWFGQLNGHEAIIARTTISDNEADSLAGNVRVNRTLEALRLAYVNISDIGLSCLADAIRDNQGLTTLSFPGTKISDSGAKALSTALQENKTLQILGVSFRSVSDGGARDFAKKMERWRSSLKTLWIGSSTNISEQVKKLLRETARRKGINLTIIG